MLIALGVLIVLGSIFLLVKQYETRMVLFSAGVLMTLVAGAPLAAFDAFAKSMIEGGLIQAICSVMGFAFVMKVTECDKHLINLMASALTKVRPILIPGATLATFAINVALPSAAGTAAAVGAIFIPILISAGVHPATAGAAVFAGTFGSMLNPGLAHNPFVAKIAKVAVMDVIAVHSMADIIAGVIGAISVTIVAKVLKEDKGYVPEKAADRLEAESSIPKVNLLYAFVPVIPIMLLVLGATGIIPALKKLGVPHAMLIGAIISVAVTRKSPTMITKTFFNGMGDAFGNVFGIIISAGTFVGGMKAIGLVDAFIKVLVSSSGLVKIAATFGPFLLAIIAGSGDAAAFAFNEAVTPHANQFGLQVINMGSIATLGGALGRTMSPIAGSAIICASLAGVNPMELTKRNAPGMIIAVIVSMFILL
jgi:DcuC family C4-dicarboxylate transporter